MEFNLLTTVLTTFVNALSAGQARVVSAGGGILRGLAVIEIVLAGLYLALGNADLSSMLKKLLQLSFWFWFATNFTSLAKSFVETLVQLGLSAGGQGGNMGLLLNPSNIASMGLQATQPLVANLHEAGLTNIGTTLVLGFCYLIIMACFFVMACQVCLAVVEYYLVLTLATCLIPFGMSPHTKFLSEKAIGAVVAVSVKLMVLSFIVSLVSPVLGQLRFSGAGGELKLNEIMSMVLVCGMLALVTWRAPGFASDLLAASPTLGIAGVGQQMTSAVSTGASAVSGAVTAGLGAAKTAASMVRAGAAGPMAAIGMVTAAAAAGLRGKGALGGAVGGGGDGKAGGQGGGQGGAKGGAQGGKSSPAGGKSPAEAA